MLCVHVLNCMFSFWGPCYWCCVRAILFLSLSHVCAYFRNAGAEKIKSIYDRRMYGGVVSVAYDVSKHIYALCLHNFLFYFMFLFLFYIGSIFYFILFLFVFQFAAFLQYFIFLLTIQLVQPCYHQSCDTLDNINKPVLGEMAQAAANAVYRFATDDALIKQVQSTRAL